MSTSNYFLMIAYALCITGGVYLTLHEYDKEYYDRWVEAECPGFSENYRIVNQTILCEEHQVYSKEDKIYLIISIWMFVILIPLILYILYVQTFGGALSSWDSI